MRFLIASFAYLFVSLIAAKSFAEDRMIVFDASGSMWGQIEGVTKIELERDAFDKVSGAWGTGEVGLIAYGHRRKGDCSDIELRVPLGQSATKIAGDVFKIKPKGKTPLTKAVRQAAEALKSTENPATVVLFSDGVETCGGDPCALAKELERTGVHFTAHVIGFGITDQEKTKQLRCVADATGGTYFDAKDAVALADALGKVAVVEEPVVPQVEEAQKVELMLRLDLGENTVRPQSVTFLAKGAGQEMPIVLGTLNETAQVITGLKAELPIGSWIHEAKSPEGQGTLALDVTTKLQEVRVPFKTHDVTFAIVPTGELRQREGGHEFALYTDLPPQEGAEYKVALYPAGATKYDQRIDWSYRFGCDGTKHIYYDFEFPALGAYEIIVIRGYDLTKAEARLPISIVDDAPISWVGPRQGGVGQTIPFAIQGDLNSYNKVALVK